MSPPHHNEPLRQQLLRSLRASGQRPRVVASNETASDWLLRVGPLAKRLNEEAARDPKDAA